MSCLDYCRTCLDKNISIKHSLLENNLLFILKDCTSIKLNVENENLSIVICENCFKLIKQVEQFKKNCFKNQKILEVNLKTEQTFIKTEPNEDISVKLELEFGDEKFENNNEYKLRKNKKNEFKNYFDNEINYSGSDNEEHKMDYDKSDSSDYDYKDKYNKDLANHKTKNNKKSNKNIKKKVDKNRPFYCKYCKQTFVEMQGLYRHNVSIKHKIAVRNLKKNKSRRTKMEDADAGFGENSKELENQIINLEYFKKDSNDQYYCEYCANIFEEIQLIHDHYFQEHLVVLTEKYLGKKLKKGYYCFICKLIVKQSIVKYHCKSLEHKFKAGLFKKDKRRLEDEHFKIDKYGHYCCSTCDFLYVDEDNLEFHFQSSIHISFVKNVKDFNLNIEELKNIRDNLLELKKEKLLQTHPYCCNLCEKFYKTQEDLDKHLNESVAHKSNVKYNKSVENQNMQQTNQITDPIANENILKNPNLEKMCKFCKIVFKNKETHLDSIVHRQNINQMNIVTKKAQSQLISKIENTCKICNVTYSTKGTYLQHFKSKLHQVMSRGNEGNNEGGDNATREEIKKSNEYHCNICNLTYFSKNYYSIHMFSHSNNGYESVKETIGDKCKYCDRRFRDKTSLYQHINLHDGVSNKTVKKNKEVICYICGVNVKMLKTHLAQTHQVFSNVEQKCKMCKETFESNESLLDHLKSVHNTSKNQTQVKCPMCGVNVVKKRLFVHMRQVHSDIRPFKCEMCEKKFKSKDYLKVHYRCHTGERPFSCEICLQAFREKSTLKSHMVTHTGERFSCDLCGKTFSQKWCIRAHKKKDHPESIQ